MSELLEIKMGLLARGLAVEDAQALITRYDEGHRVEVLAEAKREVMSWLAKKAREGTPVERLADKVDRGAIRLFLGIEEKASATTAPTATPDFFQPGHAYTTGNGFTAPELIRLFRVEHVTRHIEEGFLRAIGWMKSGAPGARWHGGFVDEDDFGLWTDITEDGA